MSPLPRRRAAFTLLELLVAMTVLAILVVMLMGLVDSATKLWRQNETRVDAYREARAALNVISEELRSLVASTNLDYFSTNVVGLAGNSDPAAARLFFLATLSPAAQPAGSKSTVCSVGYFLRWARQNANFGGISAADPTPEGRHLFRSFYPSDLTYSNLVQTNPPLRDLAEPTAQGAPSAEILARNICAFEVKCYTTNGATAAQKYTAWTPASGATPQLIEVRLTAIPDELARRLDGKQADWTTNSSQVKQQMRTFVSRISIPPASP